MTVNVNTCPPMAPHALNRLVVHWIEAMHTGNQDALIAQLPSYLDYGARSPPAHLKHHHGLAYAAAAGFIDVVEWGLAHLPVALAPTDDTWTRVAQAGQVRVLQWAYRRTHGGQCWPLQGGWRGWLQSVAYQCAAAARRLWSWAGAAPRVEGTPAAAKFVAAVARGALHRGQRGVLLDWAPVRDWLRTMPPANRGLYALLAVHGGPTALKALQMLWGPVDQWMSPDVSPTLVALAGTHGHHAALQWLEAHRTPAGANSRPLQAAYEALALNQKEVPRLYSAPGLMT